MRPGLQFTLLSPGDGDGFLSYRLTLSNGLTTTSFEFYGYDDEFRDFAKQLENYPRSSSQVVTHQVGNDDPEWAYFLHLEVFCYEPNGASAIRIRGWSGKRTSYHQQVPNYQQFEFFIPTLPADLNRLGQRLSSWNPLDEAELTWSAT